MRAAEDEGDLGAVIGAAFAINAVVADAREDVHVRRHATRRGEARERARRRSHPLVALVAIGADDNGDEIGFALEQRRIDGVWQHPAVDRWKEPWLTRTAEMQ